MVIEVNQAENEEDYIKTVIHKSLADRKAETRTLLISMGNVEDWSTNVKFHL